jgi:hypothetical protein
MVNQSVNHDGCCLSEVVMQPLLARRYRWFLSLVDSAIRCLTYLEAIVEVVDLEEKTD